ASRKTIRLREVLIGEPSGWDEIPGLRMRVSMEETAIHTDATRRLRLAIRKLSVAEQEIVSLLVERDLTLQDVSAILEIPVGTVKSHMHRAKSKLKAFLSEA